MEEKQRTKPVKVLWGLVPADPKVPNVEAADVMEARQAIMHIMGLNSWPPGAKVAPLDPAGATNSAARTRAVTKKKPAPSPDEETTPEI